MKRFLSRTTAFFVAFFLVTGCASLIPPAPEGFLKSANDNWNQWANQTIDVDFTDVRITHLPLTDAFTGLHLVIARADAPIGSLPVTLHAQHITRRQALWLISRKYGLKLTLENVPGQPLYLGVAKQ
ncbi:MAG TPA: hypothetical protein VL171_01315 [Verrucomicrobiae bacterium]|nr:hypothetical protein [Verrucomicrobiae bacterium]